MDEPESYIARCRCGCKGIIMAMVDNPERKRDIAKDLAKGIRQGYQFERMTTADVRQSPFGCQAKKETQPMTQPTDGESNG